MNKKVETAKAALEFSRDEHDKYMKWKNEGEKPTQRRGNVRDEKVPDWFYKTDKDEKGEKIPKAKPAKKDEAIEEERRKLLKELGITGSGLN